MLRLRRHAADGEHTAAAKRSDQSPAQVLKQCRLDDRRVRADGEKEESEEKASQHRVMIFAMAPVSIVRAPESGRSAA
jgi:hypothetical protein